MIVPEERLLYWVAWLLFPLTIVAATLPSLAPAAGLAAGAFILAAALDALAAPRRVRGLALELPELTRMTRHRPMPLAFKLRNDGSPARRIALALGLPSALESELETMTVAAPEPGMFIRLEWPAVPVERGSHFVRGARVEVSSPLGLWAARAELSIPNAEVRVYPDLFADRRGLEAMFLSRGGVGVRLVRQIGKGHEFEKLREYAPGDSYEDIHWKATGRRGKPITKVFQIERTQEVYVVLDASRLSARLAREPKARGFARGGTDDVAGNQTSDESGGGAGGEALSPLLDRCIRAALILAMAAERQGDKFGLIVFSDRVLTFIPAGAGQAHYGRLRDALYTLEPRRVSPDFGDLFRLIRLRLRRRALLVFLTNLDDPALAESFTRDIELISRQHISLVNMIAPRRAKPLFNEDDPPATSAEDVCERLAGHLLRENLRRVSGELHRRGVKFSLLDHETLAAEVVKNYLTVKRRQLI